MEKTNAFSSAHQNRINGASTRSKTAALSRHCVQPHFSIPERTSVRLVEYASERLNRPHCSEHCLDELSGMATATNRLKQFRNVINAKAS